jgi:hypothetical protein
VNYKDEDTDRKMAIDLKMKMVIAVTTDVKIRKNLIIMMQVI